MTRFALLIFLTSHSLHVFHYLLSVLHHLFREKPHSNFYIFVLYGQSFYYFCIIYYYWSEYVRVLLPFINLLGKQICFSTNSLILFLPAMHSDCQGDFSLEEIYEIVLFVAFMKNLDG